MKFVLIINLFQPLKAFHWVEENIEQKYCFGSRQLKHHPKHVNVNDSCVEKLKAKVGES